MSMTCILYGTLGARFFRVRAVSNRPGARLFLAMAKDDPQEGGATQQSVTGTNCVSIINDVFARESGLSSVKSTKSDVELKLRDILINAGVGSFEFKRVPPDYYERPLEGRREVLEAASIDHLCKSMIMVNTQAPAHITDCSDRKNSKYYVIVVQYNARLNAEKVKKFLYDLNEGKIPKKRFNLRLAPEEESEMLSGYQHNAVTPIGMTTEIPVIMSDAIAKLEPDFFWLGGGEVDLKLGIKAQEFIDLVKPFVIDCTYSEP